MVVAFKFARHPVVVDRARHHGRHTAPCCDGVVALPRRRACSADAAARVFSLRTRGFAERGRGGTALNKLMFTLMTEPVLSPTATGTAAALRPLRRYHRRRRRLWLPHHWLCHHRVLCRHCSTRLLLLTLTSLGVSVRGNHRLRRETVAIVGLDDRVVGGAAHFLIRIVERRPYHHRGGFAAQPSHLRVGIPSYL